MPESLRERLLDLPVTVERLRCLPWQFPLPGYAGGLRPTGLVVAEGEGVIGYGEHVAFTAPEQTSGVERIPHGLKKNEGRLRDLLPVECTAYERAAVEAALIDLAMRQAGCSLATFTGTDTVRLRYVISCEAQADPLAWIERWESTHGPASYKLDVHPGWSPRLMQALGRTTAVVTLDFKGQGSHADAIALANACPHTLLEDPPCALPDGAHVARDASILNTEDARLALARGEAVNLKGPRMGGFLEVLAALEASADLDRRIVYLGGMHEVGPGREQARQLAALYCAEAPNDLGPLEGTGSPLQASSPAPVSLSVPGFGGWSPERWTSAAAAGQRLCVRTRT